MRILLKVKSLRAMVTLVLLALWPLAVMHCKLENIPGLEYFRCASDAPTSSDCQADGCETVESATYKTPDNQNVAPQPVFETAVLPTLVEQDDSPSDNHSCRLITAAPPELRKIWQFSFRTALPPRPPSFVS